MGGAACMTHLVSTATFCSCVCLSGLHELIIGAMCSVSTRLFTGPTSNKTPNTQTCATSTAVAIIPGDVFTEAVQDPPKLSSVACPVISPINHILLPTPLGGSHFLGPKHQLVACHVISSSNRRVPPYPPCVPLAPLAAPRP